MPHLHLAARRTRYSSLFVTSGRALSPAGSGGGPAEHSRAPPMLSTGPPVLPAGVSALREVASTEQYPVSRSGRQGMKPAAAAGPPCLALVSLLPFGPYLPPFPPPLASLLPRLCWLMGPRLERLCPIVSHCILSTLAWGTVHMLTFSPLCPYISHGRCQADGLASGDGEEAGKGHREEGSRGQCGGQFGGGAVAAPGSMPRPPLPVGSTVPLAVTSSRALAPAESTWGPTESRRPPSTLCWAPVLSAGASALLEVTVSSTCCQPEAEAGA